MIYKLLKEFLFNNNKNLIEKIMEAYTQLLKIKHQVIISYYPYINNKVKNFNGFLGSILIKLMIN